MLQIASVGMMAEFVGAVLMVLPDIPFIKSFIFSSTLEDARRELFDTSSITEGSDEFDALEDLIRREWSDDLQGQPWLFLMERVPPLQMPHSIFAIYDEDSEGPFGDLMDDGEAQSLPDQYDNWPEYIHENDKWDAVCAKQKLDKWVSKEASNKNRNILIVRGVGFLFFIVGFGVQII